MAEVQIVGRQNGPLRVSARAHYVDAEGHEQVTPGEAFFLCRCGGSSKKPFCDGTHRKIGFEAAEVELTIEG